MSDAAGGYFIFNGGVFSLTGIRVSWRRVALDAGALVAVSSDGIVAGPLVGLSFPF
jgi:hypothetical protein